MYSLQPTSAGIGVCLTVLILQIAGKSLEEIDTVFMLEAKVWPGCYLGKGQVTSDDMRAAQAEQGVEEYTEKPENENNDRV